MTSTPIDVVVVGSGLAGLAAATRLGLAGRRVTLFEKADELGGRARTATHGGARFNVGPHALYRRGEAARLLRELGVRFTGRLPIPGRALAITAQGEELLPVGAGSLLRTRLFSWRDKLCWARFLASLSFRDPRALAGISVREWLAASFGDGIFARSLAALVRLTTYSADHETLSAGAALGQLKSAITGNVLYVDDGWQSLVDGLAARARAAGVSILPRRSVVAVHEEGDHVVVEESGGVTTAAKGALLAVAPDEAVELLRLPDGDPFVIACSDRKPVRAAVLDVAVAGLARPECGFALGIDQPWYLSVHSTAARLAPAGIDVVHVARYLGAAEGAEPSVQAELEGLLDRVQPEWRARAAATRFLPRLTVAHDLPQARRGGLAGRVPVAVRAGGRRFVAGDWVGGRGLLADAAAASAREAADALLALTAR